MSLDPKKKTPPKQRTLTPKEYAELLPKRSSDSYKYSHGTVLVAGGSRAYPGAAVLCALGAARSGAGYVEIATTAEARATLQAHLLDIPVMGLASRGGALSDINGFDLWSYADARDVLVLGPGLTITIDSRELVNRLVQDYEKPLVLDADGLSIAAKWPGFLMDRKKPAIITPHIEEAKRLARIPRVTVGDLNDPTQRVAFACELSDAYKTVVLLKGPGTIVAYEDVYSVCPTGTSALATAGTGDVLSGMIGALAASGLPLREAGELAAYVHGLAGEIAEERVGTISVRATDVVDALPEAFRRCEQRGATQDTNDVSPKE